MARTSKKDRPAALLACPLPREARQALAWHFELEDAAGLEEPDPAVVAKALAGKEVLIASVTLRMDAGFIGRCPPTLKAIGTYSVGHDHVDLDACRHRAISVYNTPDVLSDAVAEVALLLLLGAARRVRESVALLESGSWKGWQPTQLVGVELAGKTLGIFGMGRIGRAVADRARCFGMDIHYSSRNRLAPEIEEAAVFHAHPRSLLAASDALILACPANDETRHFLNRERIEWLKPGAIIVNVSRGIVVDDDALIDALGTGQVKAAGLDVFDGEPKFDGRYLRVPNVFALPHIGSSTIEARTRMAEILAKGITQGLKSMPVANRLA